MAKIPDHFIKQLLQSVDIVHVVGQYLPLKKSGENYFAPCPFHKEKTPSFSVSHKKQRYQCFGCKANGDVIQFIIEQFGHSFVDAVKMLASMYGIVVPYEQSSNYSNNENNDNKGISNSKLLNSRVYACLDTAAKFFFNNLKKHNLSSRAISYFKQRGLTGQTAKEFNLGYVPSGWDNLIKHLQKQFTIEEMIASGVVIKNDRGRVYDRFRDRIIFPIYNRQDKVIGFGGRTFSNINNEPKYLNSPETSVFNKGRELYGLNKFSKEFNNYTNIIVVEGYIDVISLWQSNIKNVVATLGTSLTEQHLKMLLHLKDEIIFCFDGDVAGQNAAWRALELCLPYIDGKHQVKFLILPNNLDPDAFVKEHGREAFLEQLKRAISILDFVFLKLSEDVDLDHIDGRSKLIARVKPLIDTVKHNYIKQMLFERLAYASGIDQSLLQKDLQYVESTLENKNNQFKKDNYKFKSNTFSDKINQNFRNRSQSFSKPQKPLSPAIRASALLLHDRNLLSAIDEQFIGYLINQNNNDRVAIPMGVIPGGKYFLALIDILKQNPNIKDEEISQLLPSECVKYHNPKELYSFIPMIPKEGIKEEFFGSLKILQKLFRDNLVEELLFKSKVGNLTEEQKFTLQEMLSSPEE